MKTKEIYSVSVQIIDRGITFPLLRKIEVHPPIEKNIKAYLNKYKYAMDLSNKFDFEITSSSLVGWGTV